MDNQQEKKDPALIGFVWFLCCFASIPVIIPILTYISDLVWVYTVSNGLYDNVAYANLKFLETIVDFSIIGVTVPAVHKLINKKIERFLLSLFY